MKRNKFGFYSNFQIHETKNTKDFITFAMLWGPSPNYLTKHVQFTFSIHIISNNLFLLLVFCITK
jgi:hypothetical protein